MLFFEKYLVAAVLVEQYQHQRHDDDDGDHDGGVHDGVQRSLSQRHRVLREGSVDPEGGGQSRIYNKYSKGNTEALIM